MKKMCLPMLVLFVFVSFGCERRAAREARQQVARELVQKVEQRERAAQRATIGPAAVTPRDEQMAREEEGLAREREVKLLEVNLAVFKGEKPASILRSDVLTWESALRQGVAGDAAGVCGLLDRHQAGQYVLNTLDGEYAQRFSPPISYAEVGLDNPEKLRELISRKVGLQTAKALLTALEKPQKASCGWGEGSFALDNSTDVVAELIRVLNDISVEPSAIGTTPAAIRALYLKRLRAEVVAVRQAFKDGKGSRSDFYAPEISSLAATARNWNFPLQDLGLTPEELDFAKTY